MDGTGPDRVACPPSQERLEGMGSSALVRWGIVGVIVIAATGALGFYAFVPSGAGPTSAGIQDSASAPTIGGPFTLVDHNGKTITEREFRGKFMLIYFGFTYCPDVCPTSLTAIAQALDMLGDGAEKIAPLFVTVDPERDTPEQMKMYVGHFHPRLIGLTGSPEQISKMARTYRVYYAKVEEGDEGGDDYLMDHTAITYLMGPDGKFRAFFGHDATPEEMAKRIREFL
jgi:protein SCO1/2